MLLPIFMTALAIAGGPAPAADRSPSREAIQQAIERSLLFLEKSAGDWKNGNNQVGADHGRPILVKGTQAACASCHHVPMTVWCMTEAKNHGFAVNDKTLDEFRHWSLTPYLKNPDLQPFAQDKFNGAKTSLNTIYLFCPFVCRPVSGRTGDRGIAEILGPPHGQAGKRWFLEIGPDRL